MNQDQNVDCRNCGKLYKFSHSTSGVIAHIRSVHSKELRDIEKAMTFKDRPTTKTASTYSEANDAFILAICTSNIPFRFVKNCFFKKFCRILDPNYVMMKPDVIRRKLMENVKTYKKEVKAEVLNMQKCFISLDGWDGNFENNSIPSR